MIHKAAEKEYKLDVFVPTYNRLDLLIPCLTALYSYTASSFHLIIFDDSTDLTPLWMDEFLKTHDNVTYIQPDDIYRRSGNCFFNRGFENCKTPYMATIMNSVRVEPEWELGPLQLLEKYPKVGIIGGKNLFGLDPGYGTIESAGIAMLNFTPVDIGRGFPAHRLPGVYECAAVQWAFALVRKEAAYPLEEDVFNSHVGWDDIDNCFVLRKRGWGVLYCGASTAYHLPRATRGDNSEEAFKKNQENAHAFYKRWGFWDEYCKASDNGKKDVPLPEMGELKIE